VIKATYILNLLNESWVQVRRQKVEVIDNPSSWKEVVSDFKDDLLELKREGAPQILRFVYEPTYGTIKAWIASQAIHADVVTPSGLNLYWTGFIDIPKRVMEISTPGMWDRQIITSPIQIPSQLSKFLDGLRLAKSWEISWW
jgi:hypothetical protein